MIGGADAGGGWQDGACKDKPGQSPATAVAAAALVALSTTQNYHRRSLRRSAGPAQVAEPHPPRAVAIESVSDDRPCHSCSTHMAYSHRMMEKGSWCGNKGEGYGN